MKTLLWTSLGVMVLALVMIPVSHGDNARLHANARPISGTIVRVDEHESSSGAKVRDHSILVWVAFREPGSDATIERSWPITNVGNAEEVLASYPVGKEVTGFYEPGSPHVLLMDALPDPDTNLRVFLWTAACAACVASLSGYLVYRRRARRP